MTALRWKLGLLLKCAYTEELAKSFSISLLAVILPDSNSEFSIWMLVSAGIAACKYIWEKKVLPF